MINRRRFGLWFVSCLLLILLAGTGIWDVGQIYAQENALKPELEATPNVPTPAVKATPLENKSSTKLPVNVPKPIKISVALVVNQIAKIVDAAGTFNADLDLRLSWQNPDQAFDPKIIGSSEQIFSNEDATAKLAKMWQPKVTFQNLAEKPRDQEVELRVTANGTVTYLQRLTSTFQTNYKLNNFPFDEQSLPITLVAKYNKQTVNFWQDQDDIDFSRIATNFSVAGWHIGAMNFVLDQFKGLDADLYPRFQAQIEMKRNPIGHLPGVFIPFFLVLLVPTLVALWVNNDLDKKIGAWSASILTMVALSFTISVRYPTLTIESVFLQMIWLGFIFQFLGLTVNTTVMNPALEKFFGGKYIVTELSNFCRWSLPLALLIMVARVVLLAMV